MREIDANFFDAALQCNKVLVNKFIKAGANINIKKDGFTALIATASKGCTEIVEMLIKAGADINIKKDGYAVLTLAASEGHIEIVKMLIMAGADIDAEKDRVTTLSLMAHSGNAEIAEILIKAGADVNLGYEDRCAPLAAALDGGHTEIAEMLVSAGANINAMDSTSQNCSLSSDLTDENDVVKIPIKHAIDSGAWFQCKIEKCGFWFGCDTYDGPFVFNVRILAFEKVQSKIIRELKKEISFDDGILWLLKIEAVNLTKVPFCSYEVDKIILFDQDDFKFNTSLVSELATTDFGKQSGIERFSGWRDLCDFKPKVKAIGALPYLLPDADAAEYFFSVEGGTIKEI